MKATLSYKSKRNIIIASVIVALLAGISTVGYFYIKGNDETARAFTQDNITTGEQTQTEGGQQGNPEQNPEQPLTPDNQGDNNGNQSQGNQNQGNQPNTNNNGTPNQENGQVPSGEFVTEEVEERTVLVSEDYMVEWTPTNILANTTTSNLGIVRPIITASKTADKTAVVEGEIITYTITATNSGRADGKAVIKDTIPTGTTFVEGSIKVNNENTAYTAEDLQNGIEVNVSKQNEQGDGKTELVFQVRVNGLESDENDKKELVGVVENKATVNEIPTEEVKTPVIIFFKNAEQSTVKAGEKILYTITLVNSSEVSGKVIVKDEAPENTTFVEGSIKVNGVEKAELTEENLKNGIEVEVKENSEVTVTFEVTVNEQNSLNDGDIIKNTAYVNEKLSNETETEFNKPVINSEKIADKTAVVAGEKLTYTIKVTNTGKADGTATVKDEVPTGTEFVEGSIAINGSIKSSLTEKDLKEGIEVDVPKANENEAGTATVSFEVIVKQGTTGMLTNKAAVNEIPTDEVKTPVITFSKKAEQSTVKAGEKILYTITLVNSSEVTGKVIVKDEAPENTTFVDGSIELNKVQLKDKDNNVLTEQNLKDGIEIEVTANSEVTLTFEVTVNEQNSLNDGDIIKNTAYVNEKPSEETETEFNKPVISSEKIANKTAVVEGEELTYIINVTNTGKADGKAIIKDEAPKGTKFVEGSITVNGVEKAELTEKDLKEGIEVDVPKTSDNGAGTATVSFRVIVEKGTIGKLTNEAKVNETPTEEVKTPVITFNKEVNKQVVKAGERLKYTITLKNTSEVLGKVTVRDNIPAETTFVDGSIELNEVQLKDKENNVLTKQDLEQGIEIEVAANSTVKLSFEVRVNSENNLNDGDIIKNTAYVNERPSNEEETEFNKPIISSEKEANKTAVVAGEKLTYTIKVTNTGKADGTATVKDEVPTGTEFVKGSIKVNGVEKAELTEKDLKEGIKVDVPKASTNGAGTATVSFEVIVKEGTTGMLTNEATVNEIPTDEVKTPVITFSKEADKETVKVGENILYTITLVNSSEVSGKVIVKDSAPTGTEFVKGSIKVNGVEKAELTEKDLKEGIKVDVPKASTNGAGTATVSFEVTVNENIELSSVINKAKVNDKDSNEVTTKVITYYTIEHYYNNVLDSSETVTSEEKEIGTVINGGYELKEQGKFKFVSDEGLPLTLVADPTQNVIKVYYEEPDITATKKDDSNGKKLVEGDKVEYTIDAINNGNVVGDATVTDEIPEGLKDISFATTKIGENDTVQLNGRTITWNVKDLKVGEREKRTIKITATVVAVEKETTITNTVKVDGKPTDETTITVTKPIIESSKTATTILKRDNKGNVIPDQDSTKAEVGDTIIYTITATNKSDVESDIEISDDLSNLPVTFIDGSIKVNGSTSTKAKYENGKVTYKSTLAANATVTLEFRVTVNEGTSVKTVIRNVAIVNGEEKDATTTVVKKVCVKTTAETVNSLDMILVLDVSGSMKENSRLTNLKSAAKNLTNKLFSVQTDSTLTLITYSKTASEPTTYQYNQKAQALKAIKNLKADGGTNFYKALEKTIDAVGDNPNRNTIVVFLTDGAPTFYTKDGEPGNHLVTSSNRSDDKNYENNLRPQIIQKAQELKAKPNTTIYSIGVGIAGNEVQYVERDVPAELQGIFDGTKYVKDRTITYHYMKVKTYAEYLLNNIASSGSYINTKDINSTFDDIFKQATSSEHIYMAEDVPVTINIPETKTIISDIQVKIGNGTPTAYTLNKLRNGIDGLKYTDGVGFTWTITDINTLNKELYISYTVQGIANN